MRAARTALVLVAMIAIAACKPENNPLNRKAETYDPHEPVAQPDLSRIFPEGAARAARAPAEMPPSPEQLAGGAPAAPGMPASENAGPPLSGTVRLAEGAPLPSAATLFVIARTGAAGPPTAVLRVPAPRFPFEFRLGPENRMIAALPWEGPFQLTARIDLDGNATTRDVGGLEGRAASPAAPGDSGIEIVLEPAG
jgi:hypothetical protein